MNIEQPSEKDVKEKNDVKEYSTSSIDDLVTDFFTNFKKEYENLIKAKTFGPVAHDLDAKIRNFIRKIKTKHGKEYAKLVAGRFSVEFDLKNECELSPNEKDDIDIKKTAKKYIDNYVTHEDEEF